MIEDKEKFKQSKNIIVDGIVVSHKVGQLGSLQDITKGIDNEKRIY